MEIKVNGQAKKLGTYYKDGLERREIFLSSEAISVFKLERDIRNKFIIRISENDYECGIRYTQVSGAWISPDLYNEKGKVRLADILNENDITPDQKLILRYEDSTKKCFLQW